MINLLIGIAIGLCLAAIAVIPRSPRPRRTALPPTALPPATARQLRAARRANRTSLPPMRRRQFITPINADFDGEDTHG